MSSTPAELACECLHGKKLLIFDFDGTLADTSPLHSMALSDALSPFGVVVDYPSVAGLRTRDAIVACFAAAGREVAEGTIDRLVVTKQTRVRTLIAQTLEPFPGVDEFLRWAKPRFRLAMYSSGSRGTVNIGLDKLGLSGWLDPCVYADDVERTKPDPDGFLRVLSITCIPASDAVIFEDSDVGVAAAISAGCDVVRMMSAGTDQSAPLDWVELVANIRSRSRVETR